MLKKTITYEDFNGNKVTEEFRFNFTKAELSEMELSEEGGLSARMQKVIDAKNTPELVKIFKKLLLESYGVISEDGKRFVKSPEMAKAFSETNAYSDFFMELATNADAANEFFTGIIPSDLADEIKKQGA